MTQKPANAKVKILKPCFVRETGKVENKKRKPGDVVNVPYAHAAELVSLGKAEWVKEKVEVKSK